MTAVAIAVACGAVTAGLAAALTSRLLVPPRRPGPSRRPGLRTPSLSVAAARLRRKRGLPKQHPDATLADALEQVARLVRSGSSMASAVSQAAADHPGSMLRTIDARRAGGTSLRDAITGTHSTAPDDRLALAVLGAIVDGGGPGANAIDRAAATIRERADIRANRRAQSAQARLSAQIMSALPIGFTGWAVATDSRTARFVFGTPFGLVCLGAGVGLDVLGWRWMRRIVGSP